MSTETATPVVREALFEVTRNGVTLPLYPTVTTRGKTAGFQYPCFDLESPESAPKVYEWLGDDIVKQAVFSKVRQALITLVKENTNEETGQLDTEIFLKNVSEWSARGETKGELIERRDNLFEELMKWAELSKTDENARPEFTRVADLIKGITAALEAKKRDKGEDAAVPAAQ
jgi:hypothetical protein